ncbi:MAG: DUF354 domain-containing protein [Bacteroidales bacterium]|jgi:predicted glycosyltransferase|nr:DUF354 domain-containing protein [Bacteroidales bacterium]
MKILFELSHPKHYYQFRYLINHYKTDGDKILILARNKDVLLKILEEEKLPYTILGKHAKGLLYKLFIIPILVWNYNRIIKRFKPDIILSKASPYALLANPFYKGKRIITPDSEVVSLTNRFVAPFSDLVITPSSFSLDFGSKHKRIDGFFEETYLSPSAFRPSSSILTELGIETSKPYFVLRFIGWTANHDLGQYGFNDEQKIELVNLLKIYGTVYISAEQNNIPAVLKPHLLKIPAKEMHQVLHFASLYIGDSQTMATEASLLGTPSIRYNSFVGPNDMSNFLILQKYGMLYNFNDYSLLIKELKEKLTESNLKNVMLHRREQYFKQKEDINLQIIHLIEGVS